MFCKFFCQWLDSNCGTVGVRSDHSANWATTTALFLHNIAMGSCHSPVDHAGPSVLWPWIPIQTEYNIYLSLLFFNFFYQDLREILLVKALQDFSLQIHPMSDASLVFFTVMLNLRNCNLTIVFLRDLALLLPIRWFQIWSNLQLLRQACLIIVSLLIRWELVVWSHFLQQMCQTVWNSWQDVGHRPKVLSFTQGQLYSSLEILHQLWTILH